MSKKRNKREPDLTTDTVVAPRCRERHYSYGHRTEVRCDLVMSHVGMHSASWGDGNRHQWIDDVDGAE